MSRRKLSAADFRALTSKTPLGVRYPPNGGRAQVKLPNSRQLRRKQRKESQ